MQRCREKQARKRTVPLSVSKHMETPLFTGRVGGWSGRTHGRRAVTIERYAPLRVPSVRYRTDDVKGSDGTLLSLAINTATGPLVLYTIGRQSALCPFRPVSRPPPFPPCDGPSPVTQGRCE